MKKTLMIFCAVQSLFWGQSGAQAYAQEMANADHIQGGLLSAYDGVGHREKLEMGLDIKFSPDWYSYWRMAGENGLPPSFDWKESKNVKSVEIGWPSPKRYTLDGMHSFIYDQEVLFPLTVIPSDKNKDVIIDLTLNMVVCHEICVPQTLHLVKNLPAEGAHQTDAYALLKKAREKLPAKKDTADFGIDAAVLGKDAIVISAHAKKGFLQTADVIVESPSILITAPPVFLQDGDDSTRMVFKIKPPEGSDLTSELMGKKITVLLINGEDALEKEIGF